MTIARVLSVLVPVVVAFPSVAFAERRDGIPVQLDVSFGEWASARKKPAPYGALWLGVGVPPLDYGKVTTGDGAGFLSLGVEGTVDGSRGPYAWSLGFGPRAGWRWRPSRGPAGPFPDAYFYGRVTPFVGFQTVADEAYLGDETRRVTTTGFGVRVGFGLTAAGWPATTLGSMGNLPSGGGGNDPCSALIGAIILALLIDHTELTYELYQPPGDAMPLEHRVGWRIGIGF